MFQALEQANTAQVAYILNPEATEQLIAVWGDAALEARRYVDRLQQAVRSIQATIRDIQWEIRSCRIAYRLGPDLIEVWAEEIWVYRVSRRCPPDQNLILDRLVIYPREVHRLAFRDQEWRIVRWSPGRENIQQDWSCP